MWKADTFDRTPGLKFVGRVLRVVHVVVDELIRTAWLAILLFVGVRVGLEACRWFWLIYPGTQLGNFYLAKHDLPPFGHLILSVSLWSFTFVVISVPYLPTIALALISRFLYVQRVFLFLLGQPYCIGLWSGLSSVVASKILAQYYELSWGVSIGLTVAPCVVYTVYAFRLGARVCPEIGPCLRWLAYVTGLYDLWIRFLSSLLPTKTVPEHQEQKQRRKL